MTAKRKEEEGKSFLLNVPGYLDVLAGIGKRAEIYAKLIDTTEHYQPDRLYRLLSEGGRGSLQALT